MKRWHFPDPLADSVLAELSEYPLLGRQVLAGRGLRTPGAVRAFMARENPGHDPLLLPGMRQAVDRIMAAAERREKVAVYGDYDADGITATAILCLGLRPLGLQLVPYLPDRFTEGYGLKGTALDALRGEGVTLVITVDCGIRSEAEVAWAQAHGLDVVLTDHHVPGSAIPPATAVVDPRLPGATYPFTGLSGAGVAYKLLQAVAAEAPAVRPDSILDLVAIGTVADLAPLLGENRYLVARGLERLRETPRLGLRELMRVAGIRPSEVSASSIAFGLAPRMNAVGRMESPQPALDLLLADDETAAARLAEALDQANRARQAATRQVSETARVRFLGLEALPYLLTVESAELGEGILGLIAARLTEEFYRPSLVAKVGPETARASLRSIPEFPITAALEEFAEELIQFGGHTTAAGFTAPAQRLAAVVRGLEARAAEALAGVTAAEVRVDAIASFDQLDEELVRFLEGFEPTGQDNPPVLIAAEDLAVLSKRAVGQDGAHLKLLLRDERRTFEAIGFRLGDRLAGLPARVDALFHLERNAYMGVETLQLNVKDLRPASPQSGT